MILKPHPMSKANTFNRQILAGFLFLLTTLTTEANVVLNWNERLIHEMRVDTLAPGIIARNLAILHSAIETAFQSAPDCPDQRIVIKSAPACFPPTPPHSIPPSHAIIPIPSPAKTERSRTMSRAKRWSRLQTMEPQPMSPTSLASCPVSGDERHRSSALQNFRIGKTYAPSTSKAPTSSVRLDRLP
jgi:hypothetical protein